MRWLPMLLCAMAAAPVAPAAVRAQQPTSPRPDSARADTAPPTPEQEHYLLGLRTAGRGVAQLRDGVDRVMRMRNARDTTRLRDAGKRLAGLCSAARGFMNRGRPSLKPTVYEPPTRTPARQLTVQIDSLIAYTGTCEASAGKAPTKVATELLAKLRIYEGALRDFRAAIGLPNK